MAFFLESERTVGGPGRADSAAVGLTRDVTVPDTLGPTVCACEAFLGGGEMTLVMSEAAKDT